MVIEKSAIAPHEEDFQLSKARVWRDYIFLFIFFAFFVYISINLLKEIKPAGVGSDAGTLEAAYRVEVQKVFYPAGKVRKSPAVRPSSAMLSWSHNFMTGKMQRDLDKATRDNFPHYDQLVLGAGGVKHINNEMLFRLFDKSTFPLIPLDDPSHVYFVTRRGEKLLLMVSKPKNEATVTGELTSKAALMNDFAAEHPQIKLYLYMVPGSDETIAMTEMGIPGLPGERYSRQFSALLGSDIPSSWLSCNIDEYGKYFFKSDHHWTIRGGYQGYLDILRLFAQRYQDIKPLSQPDFVKVAGITFRGTRANRSAYQGVTDELWGIAQRPQLAVAINGHKMARGFREKYADTKLTTDIFTNHYAIYFGEDFAEVTYTNNNSDNSRVLLCIAGSYSQCIEPLLAQHFKKAIFIDPRHYQRVYGKPFNVAKLAEEFSASDILLLPATHWITSTKFEGRYLQEGFKD